MLKNMPLVDAVLVTYYPDKMMLSKVIESITKQVRFIYIIDNTPNLAWEVLGSKNSIITRQGENLGISQAQNFGIKQALSNNAEYIILSDQDTIYPLNFSTDMVSAFKVSGGNVAAIAPLFKDVNHKIKNEGFITKGRFGFNRIFPLSGKHRIFQAIASGMVIRAKNLESIGLMDESLFIDWVDIEWCWRANKKGYAIIGNADVCVMHRLGDNSVNVGFRDVNLRSPIRHYFIIRNAFHLSIRCVSLDIPHRIVLFLKSFRYLIGFPILSKPHWSHLKFSIKGFIHGISGKIGNYR